MPRQSSTTAGRFLQPQDHCLAAAEPRPGWDGLLKGIPLLSTAGEQHPSPTFRSQGIKAGFFCALFVVHRGTEVSKNLSFWTFDLSFTDLS